MAPPGFLLVQLPREIYKSNMSGCTMVPTIGADLEPTTDIHHLLPLLHIVDPTQSWLPPFLVGYQVSQTAILRGSDLLLTILLSGHRCFACQCPMKFGQGGTDRCDHGSLGCHTYTVLPHGGVKSSPIFS